MKNPGALITFEGLDGCGKSTQLNLEAERLHLESRPVMVTKEPGGTAVGRQVREIVLNAANGPLAPATELALMFAARAQHIEELIRPALAAGQLVLCDRFTDSTVAYQGYGRGLPLGEIDALNQILCRSFRPDLTLFLDIDPESAAQRTRSRNQTATGKETRFEDEGLEFFRRVRQGYCDIARGEPERFRIVDGRGGIAEVHQRVLGIMDDFLTQR